MDRPFAELARHASQHHGLFRTGDALERGVSKDRLQTLIDSGWCIRHATGVYRVAAAPLTGRQRVLAEVWGHRIGAVASHRGAAYLEGLVGYRTARPEVTLEHGSNQRGRGTVHVSLWLPSSHTTVIDNIPVTRVARTLFDLAGVEPQARVEIALDDALSRRLCTLREINRVFFALARRGRKGTAMMRELLEDRGEGYVPPASELERRARRIFAEAGLPVPAFEVELGEDEIIGRVDCVWRDARLIVELDGQRFHGSRSAREADRQRDNRLVAAGWRVIRVTWDDLKYRAEDIVDQIRRALASAA
ncbi:MAG: DUF559 domain-containing protein [Aquihabitans sp.]